MTSEQRADVTGSESEHIHMFRMQMGNRDETWLQCRCGAISERMPLRRRGSLGRRRVGRTLPGVVIVGLDQPPSSEMYHVLAERFRADWPVELSFQGKGGWIEYPRIDANGEVHTLWRYYDIGYERGPWPEIRRMIEWLWRHTESPVRYGGDVQDFDELPVITREKVDEIQQHYDAYGHEPYRAAFRR